MDTAWEARSPRTERESAIQPGRSGDKERAPTLPRQATLRSSLPSSMSQGPAGLGLPTLHPCTALWACLYVGEGGGSCSRLPPSKPDPYI